MATPFAILYMQKILDEQAINRQGCSHAYYVMHMIVVGGGGGVGWWGGDVLYALIICDIYEYRMVLHDAIYINAVHSCNNIKI